MKTFWLAAICYQMVYELVACAPAVHVEVEKRAVSKSMDFLELKKTCLERGWYDCYNGLQEIWAKTDTSKPNSTVSRCIASARRYQNTSAAASTLASANDTTVGTDSCPQLDSAKKTEARLKYCDLYTKIKFVWMMSIKSQLNAQYMSVSYDVSIGALTPGKLKDALLGWNEEVTSRHFEDSPCCNTSGLSLLFLQKRSTTNWCMHLLIGRARNQCLWEKTLVEAGATMRTSELLESLGRLQKCLRGCASIEEVNCSNMLPFPGR